MEKNEERDALAMGSVKRSFTKFAGNGSEDIDPSKLQAMTLTDQVSVGRQRTNDQ